MAITNIIEVTFGSSHSVSLDLDTAYLYNSGIYLKPTDLDLPESYQVHFANSKDASTSLEVIGTEADGALIPYDVWENDAPIYAWYYLHPTEDSAVTAYAVQIFKHPRAGLPDGTEPSESEQTTIDTLVTALNTAVADAESAQEAIENMTVSAESLAEGETATVTKTETDGVVNLAFGIPIGATGAQGETGESGVGIASVVLNADYTLTITLTDGTAYTTESIRGAQGETGQTGATGATGNGIESVTLASSVGLVDTYTITFTDGSTATFTVTNGQDGSDADATEVQIDGTSITSDGVANIPVATEAETQAGTAQSMVTPSNQYASTFYGLAKASGDTTQASSDNAVGTYTDDAKGKIREMLGTDGVYELAADETLEADVANTRWWRIYLPRRTKQVFIYANILASTGTTTLCVTLADDVGSTVITLDTFGSGINTTAKNHLFEYAFMSGGGLILRQYNNDNSASQLRRQLITKKENANEWFYSVALRPYNELANIPAGSRIRVFIK